MQTSQDDRIEAAKTRFDLGFCVGTDKVSAAGEGRWMGRGLVGLGFSLAVMTGSAMAQDVTPPTANPPGHAAAAKVTGDGDSGLGNDDSSQVNDSYQPKGIELGQFLLLPKVEVDQLYNSNVYATESNAKGDFVTNIHPEMNLRSRFKEHELNISLAMDEILNYRYTREDRTNINFGVNGRYDLNSNGEARYNGQFYTSHEDRGSPDAAKGSKPTPMVGITQLANVKQQFGRYTALGEVTLNRFAYDSVPTDTGTTIHNGDRDRWEIEGRLRGGYEFSPGYAALVQGSVNTRVYDETFDRNGYRRDSNGYRFETGLGVDLSQLVRGDFLVGYMSQDYRDSRFKDPSGLSVRATLNWTPSKLTIIIPQIERTVNETTSQQVSSRVRNGFNVTVRHELQRNVILSGYANIAYDQMTGVSNQNAWYYEARARATYAFTREVYTAGEVSYLDKNSEQSGSSYRQATFLVKLGLQY